MHKIKIKEDTMKSLFQERRKQAELQYKNHVANTPLANSLVHYRGQMFNPLKLRPHQILDVVTIAEDSAEAIILNRLIRLNDDIAKADGNLTYVLNFVESFEEYLHVVAGAPLAVKPAKLHIFMEESKDKIQFFKRMRILSECIT